MTTYFEESDKTERLLLDLTAISTQKIIYSAMINVMPA